MQCLGEDPGRLPSPPLPSSHACTGRAARAALQWPAGGRGSAPARAGARQTAPGGGQQVGGKGRARSEKGAKPATPVLTQAHLQQQHLARPLQRQLRVRRKVLLLGPRAPPPHLGEHAEDSRVEHWAVVWSMEGGA